jgi:hypothetical protein
MHVSPVTSRGDIFRPQTRRFGEITVLYTLHIITKTGVYWVHSVREQVLYQSKYFVKRNKAIVLTLWTQFTPNLSSASCVYNTVISLTRHGLGPKMSLRQNPNIFDVYYASLGHISILAVFFCQTTLWPTSCTTIRTCFTCTFDTETSLHASPGTVLFIRCLSDMY